MRNFRVPLYRPSLKGNEQSYVKECLDTGWLSWHGRFVGAFEEQFAAKIGVDHALATCNGTAALHLALLALGIGPGDEVIVPSLTYISCANTVAYTGAIPVFADSLRDTWQIDPAAVERCITPRTRAIMAVHLYGLPCDMDRLVQLKQRYDLYLIEDCSEAFASAYNSRNVGSFGEISAFSFFGNKTITTGEGGMVVTGDSGLSRRCRRLRGQGLAPGREYWHDMVGYNYRMSNITAAIGLAQLERTDELVQKKRALAQNYFRRLAHVPLEFHREAPSTRHSYWMVSALAGSAAVRDDLRTHLAAAGIETRPVFHPIHTMPIYAGDRPAMPVAEDLAARGFNLPSWPDLSEAEFELVCRAIEEFFGNA